MADGREPHDPGATEADPRRGGPTAGGGDGPGTVEVTVGICTYNRSRLLKGTLEAMTRLRVPDDLRWELLVVDNAGTDDTPAVLEAYRDRLPLRPLHEPRSGKSFAANKIVQEASAPRIVWTDDDVIVDPDWLVAYRDAFRAHPGASFFGGPIEPVPEGTPPSWFHAAVATVGGVWAAVDFGPEPRALDANDLPLGANMALTTAAHAAVPFDTRLGPRPRSEIRGEETQMMRRLLAGGHSGVWVPAARVQHVIPPQRQTLAFVRRFFVGQGETEAILHEPRPTDVLGRPAWVWRQAVVSEVRYRWLRLFGSPDRWLSELAHAATAHGFLRAGPGGGKG